MILYFLSGVFIGIVIGFVFTSILVIAGENK